jgi:GNAT superfamily N-acetyltransferase
MDHDRFFIESLHSLNAMRYLNDLAQLRIEVFREYPYLYQGSMAYEERYLERYFKSESSVVFMVRDKGSRQVIGASTAISLVDEEPSMQELFARFGYDPKQVFYYGESVLLPAYRGLGIGREFFRLRRHAALRYGANFAAFCAVIRSENHPLCPKGYRPLDDFWKTEGFTRQANMVTQFKWQDVTESAESEKTMVFWLKQFS